jgi:hypothetical protein
MVPWLTREERADFLPWLFSDEQVARRPEDRKLAARVGQLGAHVSRQHCHYLHGTDLTERIYVAVKELERSGFIRRAASAIVARLPYAALQSRLGKSRRGRPSARPKGSEFSRKIETIRRRMLLLRKAIHDGAQNTFPTLGCGLDSTGGSVWAYFRCPMKQSVMAIEIEQKPN